MGKRVRPEENEQLLGEFLFIFCRHPSLLNATPALGRRRASISFSLPSFTYMSKLLADQLLEHGRRVLRSKKEFSPFQLGQDLVIQHINAHQLFKEAYSDQQMALADVDGDPADTYEPSPRSSSFLSVFTPMAFQPLSSLITPIDRTFPTKQLLSDRYLALSAKDKAKLKARDAYRRKRNNKRQKEMDNQDASCKGYVLRHVQGAALIMVSNSSFSIPPQAWSGSRQGQAPSVLSSPDVFRLSGLKLIERDGRLVKSLHGQIHSNPHPLLASPRLSAPQAAIV